MIAELFKERSRRFTTRCAKYSRYVFNDHFILVLLFFWVLSWFSIASCSDIFQRIHGPSFLAYLCFVFYFLFGVILPPI